MPWSDLPQETSRDGSRTVMTCRLLPPTHRHTHSRLRVEIVQPGVGLWWQEWEALRGRLGASQLDEIQATVAIRLAGSLLSSLGVQLDLGLQDSAGPPHPRLREAPQGDTQRPWI